jgi:hypothetical protein
LALSRDGFDDAVRLPPGLTVVHLRSAIDFVEEKAEELIEMYFEQANVFSGIVGMFGVRALGSLSPYKKHKHPDAAQQRFPDLSLGGKPDPPPNEALESKGSTRAWAIQSHYDHPGWYIAWRYAIDPTKRMKGAGRWWCGASIFRFSGRSSGSMRAVERRKGAAGGRTRLA